MVVVVEFSFVFAISRLYSEHVLPICGAVVLAHVVFIKLATNECFMCVRVCVCWLVVNAGVLGAEYQRALRTWRTTRIDQRRYLYIALFMFAVCAPPCCWKYEICFGAFAPRPRSHHTHKLVHINVLLLIMSALDTHLRRIIIAHDADLCSRFGQRFIRGRVVAITTSATHGRVEFMMQHCESRIRIFCS